MCSNNLWDLFSIFSNSSFLFDETETIILDCDSEKYEKASLDISKSKKKEDTKIRYIVSKIDKATEYYSKNVQSNPKLKKEIEKYFYVPLSDRNVVLINDTEEIKIINKLLNLGRRSIENNEFYNDLINYRLYPYINFKEFKTDGFSLNLDKTVDIVRYCNYILPNNIMINNVLMFKIFINFII